MKISVLLIIFFCFTINKSVCAGEYLPLGLNYYDDNNFISDEEVIKNTNRIQIKPNTNYVFFHFSENSDYYTLLVDENIYDSAKGIKVLLITDTIKIDREFDYNYSLPNGVCYFVNFKTGIKDHYIYYMEFLGNSFVSDNDSFCLIEGTFEGGPVEFVNPANVLRFVGDDVSKGIFDLSYDGVCIVDSNNPLSIEEIKSNLTATDNIDGNIEDLIFVLYDEYTNNEKTVNNYIVKYAISDSSNNLSTYNVLVEVLDVTAPIFNGEQYIKYYLSDGEIDLLSYVEAIDDVDGDVSNSITITSNPFLYRPGQYIVTYSVSDSSNNISTRDIRFVVYDDVLPVITANGRIISKTIADTLTIEQLREMLAISLEGKEEVYSQLVLDYDEYTGNENKVGEYEVMFSYYDESFILQTEKFVIKVLDNINEETIIENGNSDNDLVVYYIIGGVMVIIGISYYVYKRKIVKVK